MKILNIHGYNGSSKNSAYEALCKLGHEVVSPTIIYDNNDPYNILNELKNIVNRYRPDIIVGTSLGGFYATLLQEQTSQQVFLVNPCLMPHLYLQKIGYPAVANVLGKYISAFGLISTVKTPMFSVIVGLQDEVIDSPEVRGFQKLLLNGSWYVEVPDGKHSGATLPLENFFKSNLARILTDWKELAESTFPINYPEPNEE